MRLRTIMGAAALMAAAPIALPGSASAAADVGPTGCHTETINLPGAAASYSECVDSDGTTNVQGIVRDTSWDGECAYLDIYFDSGRHSSAHACGTGERASFSAYGGGNARVYLSERW